MGKINLKNFREALEGSRGNITRISERIGVRRISLYQFIEKHPYLREEIEQEKEKIYDTAEDKLHKAMQEGEPWAVKITLLNHKKGQARGYGERLQLDHEGTINNKIELEIVDPKEQETDNED
jgi:hypothetical protein